ncbi:MAG TPA: shikimate dehydrogenase [Firmicutes bacterium]|jgi:shikimate dehydrogenase|nr:shikimate dehydrogenase [Bacillota bacterium]
MVNQTINGSTKILAIFGDPVEHSLSPLMHNAAFSTLGWNCVYIPFRVRPADLGDAVRSIRSLNLKGVNITIPHKQAVMAELNQIIGDSQISGSVNTIINRDGRLIGTSTDGVGFVRSLREEGGFEITAKNCLLFGAGGAARAVIYDLLAAKINSLVIVNRDFEKAISLQKQIWDSNRFAVGVQDLTKLQDLDWESFDLIINSTSVGLHDEDSLVPLHFLKPGHFVYDLVYKKGGTQLYRDATAAGSRVLSGISLLLYQGVESFRLWFDVEPPVEIMRQALYRYYEGDIK